MAIIILQHTAPVHPIRRHRRAHTVVIRVASFHFHQNLRTNRNQISVWTPNSYFRCSLLSSRPSRVMDWRLNVCMDYCHPFRLVIQIILPKTQLSVLNRHCTMQLHHFEPLLGVGVVVAPEMQAELEEVDCPEAASYLNLEGW